MQPCDGGDEAEAKAAARRAPALFDPVESPQHRVPLRFGNARARIADLDAETVFTAHGAQRDPSAGRRELDGVIDEIADRLEQQARVAGHFGAGGGNVVLDRKQDTLPFGYRFVEFGHVGRHRGQVERSEPGAPGAGLDLGDAQQGPEGGENALGLDDRLIDRRNVFLGRCIAPTYPLQPGEKAGERRPQVVCDVFGDALHVIHQPLNFVQHAVDHLDKPIDIAAFPAGRETPAQIAVDDALDRLCDPIDPTEGSSPGEYRARHPQGENH
jgi:hypothetical protein